MGEPYICLLPSVLTNERGVNLTLANYRGQETPDRQSGAATAEDNRLQQQKKQSEKEKDERL